MREALQAHCMQPGTLRPKVVVVPPSPRFLLLSSRQQESVPRALGLLLSLLLCFPQQYTSLPTTPVLSTHTLIHLLRQIPPWALKGDAQDVPLSFSQAISASLQLNLCRKDTARTQPSHVCFIQHSHGAPVPSSTPSPARHPGFRCCLCTPEY